MLLFSVLFLIIGALLSVLAIKKIARRPVYPFFAVFFLLVGAFLLLSHFEIIPIGLARGWPFLSVFAGIALFPAGWRHFQAIRIKFLIPALVFILLGFALLPFSFKLVDFKFKRFMINWWPLLLLIAVALLVFLSVRKRPKDAAN
jgi:hypothetical protein